MPQSRRTAVGLAGLALLARVPAFVSSAHLTFDDGVFGASAVAMRHGGLPFRDVFSSQGPLFLPLVWLGDIIGLRTANAPRVLSVLAGVAITLLVYWIGRRLGGEGVGILAALTAGLSGSVLWTTGPLAADGVGLALALAAVATALSHRDEATLGKAIAIGGLIGASFAVKSLFAVPPAMVIAWVFLERREWARIGAALAAALAVVVVTALPWGLPAVWDQAVDYHLDAAGSRTPGGNLSKVATTAWDRDLLVIGLLAAGIVTAVSRRARSRPSGDSARRPHDWWAAVAPIAPVAAWLVAILLVLVLEHPLWRPHLTHLVAPAAIMGAYAARAHLRAVGITLALVGIAHLVSNRDILWPVGYDRAESRAVADLEALPPDAIAIGDEPGFMWRAGLRTPDDLVDASVLRIDSGRLTGATVAAAAGEEEVCAVLVWSSRFERLGLRPRLAPLGYEASERYGGNRVLFSRPCPRGPGA